MKIIHCADLHLDSKMSANLNETKAKLRRAEILATYERMVDYAVKNDVKAILIAGDFFDTRNISATTRNAVLNSITRHPGIAFFYLKGNHDHNNFLTGLEERPKNLLMFDKKWTCYQFDGINIYGKEIGENQADVCDLHLNENSFNIVMLHGQEGEEIDLRALRNKGIDYLALGHIHKYKKEPLDARASYCYPGCLEGRGFDECGEHGFVLLDIEEKNHVMKTKFVPFAKRRVYEVMVDISEALSSAEIISMVNKEIRARGCTHEDLLKLILTGECDMELEKNTDYLHVSLENRFFAVKVEDLSKLRLDVDRYLLDQSLKGEFVRMVMADLTMSDEEKVRVIRYGLAAISGEEIA